MIYTSNMVFGEDVRLQRKYVNKVQNKHNARSLTLIVGTEGIKNKNKNHKISVIFFWLRFQSLIFQTESIIYI